MSRSLLQKRPLRPAIGHLRPANRVLLYWTKRCELKYFIFKRGCSFVLWENQHLAWNGQCKDNQLKPFHSNNCLGKINFAVFQYWACFVISRVLVAFHQGGCFKCIICPDAVMCLTKSVATSNAFVTRMDAMGEKSWKGANSVCVDGPWDYENNVFFRTHRKSPIRKVSVKNHESNNAIASQEERYVYRNMKNAWKINLYLQDSLIEFNWAQGRGLSNESYWPDSTRKIDFWHTVDCHAGNFALGNWVWAENSWVGIPGPFPINPPTSQVRENLPHHPRRTNSELWACFLGWELEGTCADARNTTSLCRIPALVSPIPCSFLSIWRKIY